MRTVIYNPYKNVNWGTQLKTELHCHTTESDGANTVKEMLTRYAELNFDVVAITDHDFIAPNTPTFPWTNYGVEPGEFDILPIKGNEVGWYHGPYDTRNQDHIISLFNDYGGRPREEGGNEWDSVQEIQSRDGLCYFAHPYNGEQFKPPEASEYSWYTPFFDTFPCMLGIFLDTALSEYVLQHCAPKGRNMYYFSASDAHSVSSTSMLGKAYMLLMCEKTESAVRSALINGNFLSIYSSDVSNTPPIITSFDITDNIAAIAVENYVGIEWIVNGVVVGTGSTFDFSQIRLDKFYFRVKIQGYGINLRTNPIILGHELWEKEYPFVWQTGVFID